MSVQLDLTTYNIEVDFISDNEIILNFDSGLSVYQNGTRKVTNVRAIDFFDGTNTTAQVDLYQGRARVYINSTASGGGGGSGVDSFNGRTGAVTPQQADYDSFFLTPAEGNATYQPLDSDLTAIAALSTTAYGRALLTLANAAAADFLVKASNLSDVSNAATALSNLGGQPLDTDLTDIAGLTPSNDDIIQRKSGAWTNRTMAQLIADLAALGTTFQPLDSDLTSIAALSTTSFGRAFLELSNQAAALSYVVGFNPSRRILFKDNNVAASNTGSTSETVMDSFLVTGGTFEANDVWQFRVRISKSGTAGNATVRVYANTTNDLTGSPVLIASVLSSASILSSYLSRDINFKNSVSSQIFHNASVIGSNDDVSTATSAPTTASINFANNQYILISIQNGSSADTVTLEHHYHEIIRT